MKNIDENTKVTLTLGQLRSLLKEATAGEIRAKQRQQPFDIEHFRSLAEDVKEKCAIIDTEAVLTKWWNSKSPKTKLGIIARLAIKGRSYGVGAAKTSDGFADLVLQTYLHPSDEIEAWQLSGFDTYSSGPAFWKEYDNYERTYREEIKRNPEALKIRKDVEAAMYAPFNCSKFWDMVMDQLSAPV